MEEPADADAHPEETSKQEASKQELWPSKAVARHADLCREAKSDIRLVSYAFNQDCSLFMCGTTVGFRVFRNSPLSEIIRQENVPALADRSCVIGSMLYSTSIFGVVLGYAGESQQSERFMADTFNSTNKGVVQIWDESKRKFVGEIRSRYEVKGLVMRRDVVIVVCDCSVSVYALERLKHLREITTYANPKGLCATASARKEWLLCCPGLSKGEVRVQGTGCTQNFQAHETEVAVLTMNAEGTRIATASEFGTVVKVFQLSDGEDVQLLHRLRVGPPAQSEVVSSIAFRPDGSFLAVAVASSSTVHFFRTAADASQGEASQEQKGLSGLLTGAIMGAMQRLGDERTFARFKIPDVDPTFDTRNQDSRISGPLVGFHKTEPRVTILHHNGMIYEVKFQPEDGEKGCTLESGRAWFQVRHDFQVRSERKLAPVAEAGGAQEAEEDAEEWAVL